jgi:hypothetical protein
VVKLGEALPIAIRPPLLLVIGVACNYFEYVHLVEVWLNPVRGEDDLRLRFVVCKNGWL